MIKKLAITFIYVFLVAFNAYAGSDNELTLNKNSPKEIKDCFETLNRATFEFNKGFKMITSFSKIFIVKETSTSRRKKHDLTWYCIGMS